MPTKNYFDKLPPFPDDIPVAKLQRISYANLLAQDEIESASLFDACRTSGFFLLDFNTCPEGQQFLEKAERMFELTEEVNALPEEELMKFAYKPPHSLFGFVK
jgi:non-haem dioxygenase in morphine synthesis N-terminal